MSAMTRILLVSLLMHPINSTGYGSVPLDPQPIDPEPSVLDFCDWVISGRIFSIEPTDLSDDRIYKMVRDFLGSAFESNFLKQALLDRLFGRLFNIEMPLDWETIVYQNPELPNRLASVFPGAMRHAQPDVLDHLVKIFPAVFSLNRLQGATAPSARH